MSPRSWTLPPLLLLLLAAPACAASDDADARGAAAREACATVRDHVVALQLDQAQAHGAALSPELADAHRAALITTLGDAYLDGCAARGAGWIACATSASSAADVTACGAVAP